MMTATAISLVRPLDQARAHRDPGGLVVALIALGVVLYGPGARAQGFHPQDRPLAAEGVIR